MEKQQKDKKSMPPTQSGNKTDRHYQGNKNAADVRGEMAIRGHHSKQENNQSNNKKDKHH